MKITYKKIVIISLKEKRGTFVQSVLGMAR